MHMLAMQFAPLEVETVIQTMADMLMSRRKSNESIDSALSRFSLLRLRAAHLGGFASGASEAGWYVLVVCTWSSQVAVGIVPYTFPGQSTYYRGTAELPYELYPTPGSSFRVRRSSRHRPQQQAEYARSLGDSPSRPAVSFRSWAGK